LIDAATPCLRQMAEVYAQRGGSVLGVETVPRSDTDKYGIVATDEREGRVSKVKQIVEKPRPSNAPSTLAVVGRYLLSPTIFAKLENTGRGAGGEIQLTDAIADLLGDESVFAYEFDGKRYDCGSKLGYLQATVEYGLKHESLGTKFHDYLRNLAATLGPKD
jgi:UTP--glucose-1-phosphate uridylyltransferase